MEPNGPGFDALAMRVQSVLDAAARAAADAILSTAPSVDLERIVAELLARDETAG
jgi:hypothetical protein